MPEGIAVDVGEGRAVIDFIDVSKRNAGVQALIDAGGAAAVAVDTHTGPRKLYIVDEQVARGAGLLDEGTETIGHLGAASDPQSEATGPWASDHPSVGHGTPEVQPVSTTAAAN